MEHCSKLMLLDLFMALQIIDSIVKCLQNGGLETIQGYTYTLSFIVENYGDNM